MPQSEVLLRWGSRFLNAVDVNAGSHNAVSSRSAQLKWPQPIAYRCSPQMLRNRVG